MEVQHDARPGLAGGGERAPAERRVDVVGVHDAGAGAAHGLADLLGGEPAPQQPLGRVALGERGGVALQHLDLLAEVLADQPRHVLDGALFASGHAVAVVQQQDHGRAEGRDLTSRSTTSGRSVGFREFRARRPVSFPQRNEEMHDMAESAQPNRTRRWKAITTTAILIAVLAATAALAATVTQRPTISGPSGALKSGDTLTANGGAWTPSTATAAFTWLRCDANGANCQGITGACGRGYKIRSADENHRLRVRLTATESNGQADSKDSDPTAEIVPDQYRPNVGDSDTCVQVTPTGPGKGTFNSGTQTGGGSTPAPATTLSFIKPFPVIRISGRFKGTRTTLTRVTVRTPKGTRVRIRCSGKGCPFKRKAVAAKLINVRALRRSYHPKATIEIRVTQAKKIGKYTKLRTRRGKAPVRSDRCLMPGKTKPSRCPTG